MKTKTSFIGRLLAFVGLRRPGGSPADRGNQTAANDDFAFKLLKQIARDQPEANIFISPYSASTALQMVANGAAGETKEEMELVLGTSSAGLNEANRDVVQSLNSENDSVILEIANSIWYRQGAQINPEFLACNQRYFGATVAPLNFADPHSVDIVNTWAGEKTHGRITRIADGMIDPVNGRLLLANAVYFKGKWSDPFESRATRDRPFYLQDGRQKTVPMMAMSKTFTYQHGTRYQAVRLPYKGENLAMYVFLPDEKSSPEKLLSTMNGDAWQRSVKPGFAQEDGDLQLPKFKIEYTVELARPLQKLGMKTAFDMNKANFSGISLEPSLHISGALQKTFVEVKEEGTEAAAVTVAANSGMPA